MNTLCALLPLILTPAISHEAAEARPGAPDVPYRILDGGRSVTIPFRMHYGDIVVDADVNGHPLVLGLDNGNIWDALMLYGSPRIDALGLEYEGEVQVHGSGSGDPVPSMLASGIMVKFPGLEILDQSAIVSPESSGLTAAFEGEDGIISGSFFHHFVVRLDFDRMTITLTEKDAFEYSGEGTEFEMIDLGTGYSLACTVLLTSGEELSIEPCIDLGGIHPLELFVDGRRDISVSKGAIQQVLGYGAQGPIEGYLGRVASLRLGNHELDDVVTGFTGIGINPGNGGDGIVGLPVFRRFHATFDYARSRLFLEPNEQFRDPFICDKSGLTIRSGATGERFVSGVVSGSPAEDAGLAVGDLVLEIDGVPAAEISPRDLFPMLEREGVEMRFKIRRGQEELEITLRLQRYF